MDQKPERQYSGMTVGGAIGIVIGLLLWIALDSYWWVPIGIFMGIAIGAVWDLLRKSKDEPNEN